MSNILPRIEIIPEDVKIPYEKCQSKWKDNDCINLADFILENEDNNGYAIMCAPHYNGYVSLYGSRGIKVHDYTEEKHKELEQKLKERGAYGDSKS